MKNIHVLPTDKPSRLYINARYKHYEFCELPRTSTAYKKCHNIYITSDEEIKEGDWMYSVRELIEKAIINYPKGEHFGKIILTTDQDLIKDGVQAIDDEFLEWFVKNPSCELFPVANEWKEKYKIIIPKEEPKHPKVFSENGNELFFDEQGNLIKEEPKTNLEKLPFPKLVEEFANYYKKVPLVEEPKQETLEEAAEKYWSKQPYNEDAFIEGAKWQQERMYSDLSELRNDLYDKLPIGDIDAFEILKVIKSHLQKLDVLCGNK